MAVKSGNNQNSQGFFSVARWVLGFVFILATLLDGFHYSKLILICAAFLILPIPFIKPFFEEQKANTVFVAVLSAVLFVVGIVTLPKPEAIEAYLEKAVQTSASTENEDIIINIIKSVTEDSVTTAPESTTLEISGTTITESAEPESSVTTEPEVTTSASSDTEAPETEAHSDEKPDTVWVTASGSKYHIKQNCSNMRSPIEIPLEDAVNEGYEPCKKCVK